MSALTIVRRFAIDTAELGIIHFTVFMELLLCVSHPGRC